MKKLYIAIFLLTLATPLSAQWVETASNLLGPVGGGAMTFKAGIAWVATNQLWRSNDSGITWKVVPLTLDGDVCQIYFLDNHFGIVSTYAGGVYLTRDGGNSWNNIRNVGSACAATLLDSNKILICEKDPGSVDYSWDGGTTWNTSQGDAWDHDLVPGPKPGLAFMLSANWTTRMHLWYSTDSGASWSMQPGLLDADCWSIAVDPCNPNQMYVVNEGYSLTVDYDGLSRLFVSSDEGLTWSVTANHPSKYFVGSVTLGPNAVFVQTVSEVNAGIFRSTDLGQTWQNVGGPSSLGDTRLIATIDDNRVIASDINGSIWITQNSGGDSLTLPNNNGPMKLSVFPINEQFNASSCETEDTAIELGIAGCIPTNGILDSAWIVGSSAIKIRDTRTMPRMLGISDSITIQYSPSGSGKDTAHLNIRYDLGSGVRDTSIIIVGFIGSTLLSAPVSLHREVGSSYFGSPDSLPLAVDISSSINIDSLWPYLHDISGTYSFDSSVVSFFGYLPPNGWVLNSLVNNSNSVDFTIHNFSSKSPSQPLDLGIAVFMPAYAQLETSDVTLTNFIMDIGNQTVAPCVTDDEDQHWSVKVLVTDGVSEAENSTLENSLAIYPNPAGDELFVQNSNELPVSITLYDAIGRAVLSANAMGSSTTTLEIQELPSGSYMLVGHIGDNVITRRVSKIR